MVAGDPREHIDECIHEVDGVRVLRGRNKDGTFGAIQALQIAETGIPVNVWADTQDNANLGYQKRVVEKRKPVALSPDDVTKIKKATAFMIGHVLTPEALTETILEHPVIEEMVSGKWSSTRAANALRDLHAKATPKMSHSVQIKNEALPSPAEGPKAPRLLIADGDAGQVMGLVTIHVLEHAMFKYYRDASIKGRPRDEAIEAMVNHWRPPHEGQKAVFVEGDGSAWDTTCSAEIRALVENPMIRHVMQFITKLGIAPDDWHEEHYKDCCKKKMNLRKNARASKLHNAAVKAIDAFRRSGHRGTSALNYAENIVLWASALADEPAHFLDMSRHTFRPRFPVDQEDKKWTRAAGFEGDDSGIRLDPKFDNERQRREVLAFWDRAGFNMKIHVRREGDVAEFVGVHFYCDAQGPTSEWRPDLMRNIASSAWTTSTAAVSLARGGQIQSAAVMARKIAVGSFLCRALGFAGRDDRSAAFFLALARGAGAGAKGIIEGDALHRLGNDDVDACFKMVEDRINWCSPAECPKIDEKLRIRWPSQADYMMCGAKLGYLSDVSCYIPRGE